MIPTTATDELHKYYVNNIIAAWRNASDQDLREGRSWYPVAHQLAETIGNGDIRMGAGVIAALSPLKSWDQNVSLAIAACDGDVRGHMPDVLNRVQAILAGADPDDILPMAHKTGHFFRNILDPSDPDPVTIDRHAHDVAVGERYGDRDRGLSSKTRYATLAHAYREAARRLGELPSVVQAVTWVYARKLNMVKS
jgi:hypothetical protein